MINIFELVQSPYERKTRAVPGLLIALPLLVPLVCVYGKEHPLLTAMIGLLGGCGAIYALASVVRGRGKKLEQRLIKEWGGMPTTIVLRHKDRFLDSISKQRYHNAITSKLGIKMPTAEDEINDPAMADDVYIGATRLLRELTRSNKQLLLAENIAYGFHRNMLAMKPIGILSCLLSIIYALWIANVLKLEPPRFLIENFSTFNLALSLPLIVSTLLLSAWLFYFDKSAVKQIGITYAERLLECLSTLPMNAPQTKD